MLRPYRGHLIALIVLAVVLAVSVWRHWLRFDSPELFLLVIPLGFAWVRWGHTRGVTGALRMAVLLMLLLALTGPEINLGGRGIDVLIVADRSRSLTDSAHQNVQELIRNLERSRGEGDRIALITVGTRSEVEHPLLHSSEFGEYTKAIRPDGTDLAGGIEAALNLVEPARPARILVLTDGEVNGESPLSAARRAREAGVPVDFRLFERVRRGDVGVQSVTLPETVAPREPFQFAAVIYSDEATNAEITLLRDEQEVSTTTRRLTPGSNRILFGDVLEAGGFYNYTVRVDVAGDPLTENNLGAGVLRVDAGPRILVLNEDGQTDNLVEALRAGRLPVDVAAAKSHPVTQDALDPYRAVIVENVPADSFGRLKMERLAQFVEDLGGGLMLTGGERSFGTGGYFKSPLDEVLPVSMEMREEHRKTRVAMAIALDRSGSMTAPVGGGKTKMDLANLGTAECVRLLSPADKVAVLAVDERAHVIQPLTNVDSPEAIAAQVLKTESMGGGIYVYNALVAAGRELAKADGYQTRHILLFSDAQDSEEPGRYQDLLKKFNASGITVSVIGLGTAADVDAKLLEEIATLGGGNIMFTDDAEELPRLFTQDTMSIARSTFLKKDPETQPAGIPGQLLPDARLMGEFAPGGFPATDGYNLSYLKDQATLAVVSEDEYQAPFSAFWYRGLGRAAALTIEVDGPNTGAFAQWENAADFLITHSRWLMSGEKPGAVFVELNRDGQDAVVTLELDPDRADASRGETPELVVVPPGMERQEPQRPDLQWTGPDSLEARFRLEETGTYRTLIRQSNGQFTRGPAVTLPYSPEFAPRVGLPSGRETMRAVSELTGGLERTDVLEVLANPPRAAQMISLIPWLVLLALLTHVLEIAGRRLSLWERLPSPAGEAGLDIPAPAAAEAEAKSGWLPQWKFRRRGAAANAGSRERQAAAEPAQAAAAEPGGATAASVFDQAKDRARRRLK